MDVADKKLVEMLWHNRIDEEFHKYWFAANLEALIFVDISTQPGFAGVERS